MHQEATDALPSPCRIDRQGTQEQGRPALDHERPVADRSYHASLGVLGHQTERLDRSHAKPVAVRDLATPLVPKGEIEKMLDGRSVEWTLGPYR
jgi:hypothetical protein